MPCLQTTAIFVPRTVITRRSALQVSRSVKTEQRLLYNTCYGTTTSYDKDLIRRRSGFSSMAVVELENCTR